MLFDRVGACETGGEIWNFLQEEREGTEEEFFG
jgi:hypothetical protein